MNIKNRRFSIAAFVIVLSGCLLGACNKDKKPATQVVASIDGVDISVYQLNDAVSNMPGVTSANATQVQSEVLKKLINQQLTAARAQATGLDRTVPVIQAIEFAKREILSRAYLDKVTSTIPKTTDVEAKKYFTDTPQLFLERRIYSLQEIVLPATAVSNTTLREIIANKSMEQIAKALRDKNIKFTADTPVKAAEQLSLALLPKIHVMKDGETQLITAGDTTLILHLVESKSEPIDEATALPRIRQYLDNQKAGAAIETELKVLKEKAKIEYTANADNSGERNQTVPGQAAPVEKPTVNNAPAVNVEKGVAGLK